MKYTSLSPEFLTIVGNRLEGKDNWGEHIRDVNYLIALQSWVQTMWNYGGSEVFPTKHDDFIMATGLGGETGEVLEILKKAERDGTPIDSFKKDLILELGDVLYYLIMICNRYDISLEDVIAENVKKLNRRKKRKLASKKHK